MFFLDNILIDEIEYVYLKHGRQVKEKINIDKINEIKARLISIINTIITDTENNTFEMCLDKKICKYCNVKKYCDEEFESSLDSK